jgi:ribulose-5-phosphate 4-epimerase/fuculose-1-phosphate aldolase
VTPSRAEVAAREKLAQAGRALDRAGIYGLSGHVSLRIPDSDLILITPGGGLDKSRLRPSDLVTIDASGERVSGPYPPPLETAIHTLIHAERPELGSIAHLHAHWATVFSVSDQPLDIVMLPARCLGDKPLPTFDEPQLVTTSDRAQRLYAAMGDAPCVLMRWHGITVVGRTLEEMFTRALALEENARILWEARAMGKALPVPPDGPKIPPTGEHETYRRTFIFHTNVERSADEQLHSGAHAPVD